MQKITVEISAKGYTGLTAENIEKALCHYFGSPALKVSFSVTEAAQQSVEPTVSHVGACPVAGDDCNDPTCPYCN